MGGRSCKCQIQCQIRGFEGIAGHDIPLIISNLLISCCLLPGSNPSLSAIHSFRDPEGQPLLRRAVELREQLDDSDSFWLAEARISLSNALIAERRFAEANQLLKQAAAAQAHQPALSNEYREPLRTAQNLIAHTRI